MAGADFRHDDGGVVRLEDPRYCRGCTEEPFLCQGAYTSRVASPERPLGVDASDWRRGEGCRLTILSRDCRERGES